MNTVCHICHSPEQVWCQVIHPKFDANPEVLPILRVAIELPTALYGDERPILSLVEFCLN